MCVQPCLLLQLLARITKTILQQVLSAALPARLCLVIFGKCVVYSSLIKLGRTLILSLPLTFTNPIVERMLSPMAVNGPGWGLNLYEAN